MKTIRYSEINESFFEKIDFEYLNSVDEIIKKVRLDGDSALIELSQKFNDGIFNSSNDFIVSENEIELAYKKIDKELLDAMKIAIKNVEEFSIQQLNSIKEFEFKKEDSILAQKIVPLNRVLCY